MIAIQRVHPLAKTPTRADEGAAGLDLYAVEDSVIPPRERRLVDTGIKIALPVGTYGRVAPRSGLALKHGIDILAGVIDRSYRGVVKVILQNLGDTEFEVHAGDRIAQLIVTRVDETIPIEVKDLDETTRGEGGFGSTGN